MNIRSLITAALAVVLTAGLSFKLFAEETSPAPDKNAPAAKANMPQGKRISAKDKAALIALFKDVDPSKYRLQFNGGKEVYGNKRVSMSQLQQVSKIRNPGETKGYVVLIVVDDGAVYIVAVTKGRADLQGVLGQEKTARLNQIMTKYQR